MQLQITDGLMQMRPIAGTRPRGADAEQDQKLIEQLLADEKELAEHRMLVDLARNDLGRVARTGSVQIDRLMQAELYSHVIHITSAVSGRLDDERFSIFDALRSTFPAGTLSGAPKVRAMQLINEFEPVRRNLYGGLVGYVDLRGNIDTCIAIRMMIAKDNVAHVQAGGGIVADSVPAAELEENPPQGAGAAAGARRGAGKMIFLLDNYDSFTYNLAQILRGLGREVKVARNDRIRVDEVAALKPQAIFPVAGAGPAGGIRDPARAHRRVCRRSAAVRGVPGNAGNGNAPGRKGRRPRKT